MYTKTLMNILIRRSRDVVVGKNALAIGVRVKVQSSKLYRLVNQPYFSGLRMRARKGGGENNVCAIRKNTAGSRD